MRSIVLFVLAMTAVPATPLLAQTSNVEQRVGKLEKEMKAVQRKVFPGGGGQYFEPEIAPPTAAPAPSTPP